MSAADVPAHTLAMSEQRHGKPSTLDALLTALDAELAMWHGVCDQAQAGSSPLSAARADSVRGALHAFGAIVANTHAAVDAEREAEAEAFRQSWGDQLDRDKRKGE
jgi:hypothetical protein